MRAILARYAPRLRYLLLAAPLLLLALRTHAEEITFENPIEVGDLADLIQYVLDDVQPLALTVFATAIIVAGFNYVLATFTGEQGKLGPARKFLAKTVGWTAVIAGSAVIIDAVVQFAKEIK